MHGSIIDRINHFKMVSDSNTNRKILITLTSTSIKGRL